MTQEPKNKWIGFDLDGTLAVWTEWGPVTEIGAPISDMVELAKRLIDQGQDVRIFTARSFELDGSTIPAGLAAIEAWCLQHLGKVLPVTNRKDYACRCILDDRAIAVDSNTGMWFGFKKMIDELEEHHDFYE